MSVPLFPPGGCGDSAFFISSGMTLACATQKVHCHRNPSSSAAFSFTSCRAASIAFATTAPGPFPERSFLLGEAFERRPHHDALPAPRQRPASETLHLSGRSADVRRRPPQSEVLPVVTVGVVLFVLVCVRRRPHGQNTQTRGDFLLGRGRLLQAGRRRRGSYLRGFGRFAAT